MLCFQLGPLQGTPIMDCPQLLSALPPCKPPCKLACWHASMQASPHLGHPLHHLGPPPAHIGGEEGAVQRSAVCTVPAQRACTQGNARQVGALGGELWTALLCFAPSWLGGWVLVRCCTEGSGPTATSHKSRCPSKPNQGHKKQGEHPAVFPFCLTLAHPHPQRLTPSKTNNASPSKKWVSLARASW